MHPILPTHHLVSAQAPMCADAVAAASFSAIEELLQQSHGIVKETAAAALRHLMPGLLGLSEPGTGSSDDHNLPPKRTPAAVRAAIVAFAKTAVR